MAPVVLIVESDTADGSLAEILRADGFNVDRAHARADAVSAVGGNEPGVVILDFDANGFSAVDLCRELRDRSDVPIVMVSQHHGETEAVLSLEVGADDFVGKPVRSRELTARLRAMIRRHERSRRRTPVRPAVLRVDDLQVDRARHEAFLAGGPLPLAPKEFAVLALLLEHAGAVVSRQGLLEHVWDGGYPGDAKTLDTHIKRLRSKIEADPLRPQRIVTVRGVGFRYETAAGSAAVAFETASGDAPSGMVNAPSRGRT